MTRKMDREALSDLIKEELYRAGVPDIEPESRKFRKELTRWLTDTGSTLSCFEDPNLDFGRWEVERAWVVCETVYTACADEVVLHRYKQLMDRLIVLRFKQTVVARR